MKTLKVFIYDTLNKSSSTQDFVLAIILHETLLSLKATLQHNTMIKATTYDKTINHLITCI